MNPQKTTLYLRGMPVTVVREAKVAAARRGSTLAELVTTALVRDAAYEVTGPPDTSPYAPDEDLAQAIAWFERNRERLVKKHPGEYVAIVGGAVADHDRDFETLATRVFARYGVRSVFMPRVERSERPVRVRSPRRVPA